MKKKIILMLSLLLPLTTTVMAQRGDDDPARREEMRSQRQKHIERQAYDYAKELKLDDATQLWFCNLYIEYQTEMARVRDEAREAMPRPDRKHRDESASTEEPGQFREKELKKLSDEDADKLITGSLDRSEKELKLKRDYYARFREKLQPSQLVRIFVTPQRGGGGNGWNNSDRQRGPFGPGGPGFPPGGGRRF